MHAMVSIIEDIIRRRMAFRKLKNETVVIFFAVKTTASEVR